MCLCRSSTERNMETYLSTSSPALPGVQKNILVAAVGFFATLIPGVSGSRSTHWQMQIQVRRKHGFGINLAMKGGGLTGTVSFVPKLTHRPFMCRSLMVTAAPAEVARQGLAVLPTWYAIARKTITSRQLQSSFRCLQKALGIAILLRRWRRSGTSSLSFRRGECPHRGLCCLVGKLWKKKRPRGLCGISARPICRCSRTTCGWRRPQTC